MIDMGISLIERREIDEKKRTANQYSKSGPCPTVCVSALLVDASLSSTDPQQDSIASSFDEVSTPVTKSSH